MRITKELEAKIKRQIGQKYEKKQTELRAIFQKIVDENAPAIAAKIDEYRSDVIFETILKKAIPFCDKTTLQIVTTHNTWFFPEAYKTYSDEMSELRTAKDREYENLAIQISYLKDINEIKEAFAELGLTF